MTPREQIFTLRLDTPVVEAAALLLEADTACLPVVHSAGRPCGVVAGQDVLRVLLDSFRARPNQATAEELVFQHAPGNFKRTL